MLRCSTLTLGDPAEPGDGSKLRACSCLQTVSIQPASLEICYMLLAQITIWQHSIRLLWTKRILRVGFCGFVNSGFIFVGRLISTIRCFERFPVLTEYSNQAEQGRSKTATLETRCSAQRGTPAFIATRVYRTSSVGTVTYFLGVESRALTCACSAPLIRQRSNRISPKNYRRS